MQLLTLTIDEAKQTFIYIKRYKKLVIDNLLFSTMGKVYHFLDKNRDRAKAHFHRYVIVVSQISNNEYTFALHASLSNMNCTFISLW